MAVGRALSGQWMSMNVCGAQCWIEGNCRKRVKEEGVKEGGAKEEGGEGGRGSRGWYWVWGVTRYSVLCWTYILDIHTCEAARDPGRSSVLRKKRALLERPILRLTLFLSMSTSTSMGVGEGREYMVVEMVAGNGIVKSSYTAHLCLPF